MKKYGIIWLIVVIGFVLTGCWDVQDITNRAYVTGIALDHVEGGGLYDYEVTFEIVLPRLFLDKEKRASIVQTVEASSIGTAIETLQARISRPLNLAHMRVILIGEKLAKEKNFLDIAGFFQRNPNVQMRIQLMVVYEAKAREILEAEPIYNKYIAKELIEMTMLNHALAKKSSFFDFLSELREHDGRSFTSRILVSEEEKIVIRDGSGIYDQWKLRGWLSSEETKNANWIVGKEIFVVDARREKSQYSYLAEKKATEIKPIHQNGMMQFVVDIKTSGPLLYEQGDQVDATNPETLRQLEALFERTIKAQVEAAIYKAQKSFGVDYLGFDSALKQTNPKKFEELDWETVFPTLPITVNVDVRLTRFGVSR